MFQIDTLVTKFSRLVALINTFAVQLFPLKLMKAFRLLFSVILLLISGQVAHSQVLSNFCSAQHNFTNTGTSGSPARYDYTTSGFTLKWNEGLLRWEIATTGGNVYFYSTYASSPKPPSISVGNWASPSGCGISFQGGTQSFLNGSQAAPSISSFSNVVVCSGNTSGAISFTVADSDNDNVSVTVASSDTVLVPLANIKFNNNASTTSTGAPGTRNITITPATGQFGTATITLTPTDGYDAGIPVSFTISVAPNISLSNPVKTNVTCFGGSTGTAGISVSGGTGNYSYSWSPSVSTARTASNLAVGSYTITVSDQNNCQKSNTFTITQPAQLVATSTQTNVSCNGLSDGSAKVTVTGGTGVLGYSWAPYGGGTNEATELEADTYTITVTDQNNCQITPTVVISEPDVLDATPVVTNISCNGLSNGSISVAPTGGTAPYTYSWSPSGGTGATASGLGLGTYTVTITDAHDCQVTRSETITQPTSFSVTASKTDVSCNNGANGTATVSVSGATPAYTYSWSPSGGTAATATGLAAGSYTVTVKDAKLCQTNSNFTITQPSAFSIQSSSTNVSCNAGSNGSAMVNVSGATSPYTYTWTGSSSTTSTASGLTAGNYSVTIKDAKLCQTTNNFTITHPSALTSSVSSQTNVSCNMGSNGTATVAASGGTAPYQYSWSPSGGSAATATGLSAGTYTVTITDANNCTKTQSVTITEPSALSVASSSSTNILCNGQSTGAASVSMTGGTGAYTYIWSPSGGSAASASGLAAGTYTVTVKDANNCQASKSFTLTQPSPFSVTPSSTNILCNGASTGSASVSVSGATPGYTYTWSPSGGSGATASNLAAGSYTVSIKDANNCSTSNNFILTQPTAFSVSTSQSNVSCNGGSNGTATISVSGATPGYTYSWSPSGATTATATSLSAGTHTVTIKDANLCTTTRTFTITQPAVLAVASSPQTNISCFGGSNGTASVSITGGTGAYSYSWSPAVSNSASASGLSIGTYTVTITDANLCQTSKTFTLTQPPLLVASEKEHKDVSCKSLSDGTAEVSTTGGAGNNGYNWTGSFPGDNTSKISSLPAGSYTCTVTDGNGCTATKSITITQPDTLVASGSSVNVNCYGAANGTISATHVGGTSPYTYSWTGSNATTAALSSLTPGNYTIKVTDKNGCNSSKAFTITQPDSLYHTGSTTAVSCFGASNGTLNTTIFGGTTPYSYQLNGSSKADHNFTGLTAGNHTLKVSDSKGCIKELTYVVTTPVEVIIAQQPKAANICNGFDTSFTISSTGGNAYQWQLLVGNNYENISEANSSYEGSKTNKLLVHAVDGLNNSMYRCVVTQTQNCFKVSDEVKLTVYGTPAEPTINYIAPLCENTPAFQLNQGVPAGGVFTINDKKYTTFDPKAQGVGTYMLFYTYTTPQGCSNKTFQQVTVKIVPVISYPTPAEVCASSSALTLSGAKPEGGKYSGEGVVDNKFTPASAGMYDITYSFTNSSKCTNTATAKITVIAPPAIKLPKSQSVCSNGQPISYEDFFTNTPSVNYILSGTGVQDMEFDPANLVAGNYYVKVLASASTGCSAVDSFLVVVKGKSAVSIESPGSICNNAAAKPLYGSPVGGTFIGDGVINGEFNPTKVNAGTYTIRYAYLAENGCTDTAKAIVNVLATPKVNISAPATTFCKGSEVTLNGGSYTSYQWFFQGEKIVGETSSKYTAKSSGQYSVDVVLANQCKVRSEMLTLNQDVITTPEITFQGSPNFCSASSIELKTGTYDSYQWYRNGKAISGATAQKLVADSAGSYAVEVSRGTCSSKSLSLSVTGKSSVVVTMNKPSSICQGDTIALTASSANKYQWYKNGQVLPNETKAKLSTATAGKYSVLVSDTNGCSLTSSEVEVKVNALPVPVITSLDNSFCPGKSLLLSTGSFNSYKWKKDQSAVSGAVFQKLEAKSAGNYSVYVSNENGCFAWSQPIQISEKPAPGTELSADGIQNICAGDTFTVTASASATSYQWFNGSQAISGAVDSKLNITNSGSYKAVLTNDEGCSSTTESVTIFTKALPQAPEISFTDSSLTATEAPNYQWYKEGTKLEGETAQTLKIFSNGTYTVEVVGENGCNSFSEDFIVSNLSIETATAAANGVMVYPNPVQSFVNIEVSKEGSYLLYDVSGKQLAFGKLVAGKNIVATADLAAGVYQLRVISGGNESFVRLVK